MKKKRTRIAYYLVKRLTKHSLMYDYSATSVQTVARTWLSCAFTHPNNIHGRQCLFSAIKRKRCFQRDWSACKFSYSEVINSLKYRVATDFSKIGSQSTLFARKIYEHLLEIHTIFRRIHQVATGGAVFNNALS